MTGLHLPLTYKMRLVFLLLDNPTQRNQSDARRKATMMMAGDKYSYWWQDKGGFNYLDFLYDKEYAPGSNDGLQSGTGANIAKHLYGNTNDHIKTFGISPGQQCSSLNTHVLRLADIYSGLCRSCNW